MQQKLTQSNFFQQQPASQQQPQQSNGGSLQAGQPVN